MGTTTRIGWERDATSSVPAFCADSIRASYKDGRITIRYNEDMGKILIVRLEIVRTRRSDPCNQGI